MSTMQEWQTQAKRNILNRGKFLQVEEHSIQLHDDTVIDDWTWVITPNFINVVLMTVDEQFVCFRQTKYACGFTQAVVGGYIEPDEDPLTAAQREVLEETGYQAQNWYSLGEWVVDANRGCGRAYGFLATAANKVDEPNADDLEEQEMIFLSRAELQEALMNNAFKVLPWSNVIALALLKLQMLD